MRFSRWSRARWGRAALAGLYVVVLAAAVPRAGGHGKDRSWTSEQAQRFWGPTRTADDAGDGADADSRSPAQRITGSARHFGGVPSVGVLFYTGDDMRSHHCTASVVHSPKGNLLVTAGHCSIGDDAAFVPDYQQGADRQPYGVWTVDRVFTDPRRTDTGEGSDLDFAFATVRPDAKGRQIEQVTGANRLVRTPAYVNRVTVIGYPSADDDPADEAIRCTAMTSRLENHNQLKMRCDGFFSGTSGSPWLTHFNEKTRTGDLIGVLGGLNGGGPDGDNSAQLSYSPMNDDEIFKLYLDAINNREPKR
ncbi:trypsin-like serine peptidase [Streptomyces caatingaensis]|uniref:trypsin-like serine peptidase n=1 Tax=Streptomyces caatingaensis TaxID=1678637 RepID=UPI001F526BEB|nr:trypsin-like serine protease [Streptomyces caatingaensis]